ncbi:hypothetical protein HYH03_005529 [Edaphochlamys debaryana]|uniref:BUB1 N-terminal domain-containing protein n=1 Tax=Edaphochlamys debaryana TaxID=47281 RepID=A0A835Y8S0_9CHLO|nr:hypothetical protein HYH03_005529 [Edaphochlamys debaryana]|eukprot:KAG2496296.1 hypothetical protein HYH03_005529 [Edaphochlamys debaryana]
MDWEQTKENCVPVRQGRSKAALQELAVADPSTQALEAKRRALWEEVANYEGDDPLEAWQRYIKWMQEYGVGGGKADLQKVLETCTTELQKHARYTNDIRFLRIWIQYADCLPDPGDVFLFLKEKGIGRDFALYYEAYATFFELRGNFQSADAVYMDGVQRGAKPLERLKQKHMAFQQRMAQRIQRRIQDEQVMGPPPPEPVRSSLAMVGGRAAGRPAQQQQAVGGIFGASGPAHQQHGSLFGSRPAQQAPHRGLRPLEIAADDEFSGGENGPPGLPGYSAMPQVNNLRELKPYGVIRKENLDRPAAWNQASLFPGAPGGAGGRTGGGSGGLEILTDEEFQEEEDERPSAGPMSSGFPSLSTGTGIQAAQASHSLFGGAAGASGTGGAAGDALLSSLAPPPALLRGLQPKPPAPLQPAALAAVSAGGPAMPLASALQGQATRGLGPAASGREGLHAQPALPPAPAPVPAAPVPVFYRPPASQLLQPTPVPEAAGGYGVLGLQHGNAGEMSCEELRALAWFRRCPEGPPAGSGASCSVSGAPGGSTTTTSGGGMSRSGSAAQALASTSAGPASAAAGIAALRMDDPENGGGAGSLQQGPSQAPSARRAFGQVISTPAASELSAGASENAAPGPGSTRQPEPLRRPLGSVGPSAAPAAAAVAVAPQQPQPAPTHNPPPPLAQPGPRQPLGAPLAPRPGPSGDDAQPTVTISTRGAFDLLNDMFSDDLPHQATRQRPDAVPQQERAGPGSGLGLSAAAPAMPTRAHAPAAPAAPAPVAAAEAAHEPTVTLHTRLAFDALNDMFSEALPHEEARKVRRGGAEAGPHKPISNSDVRRLANASRGLGAGACGASGGLTSALNAGSTSSSAPAPRPSLAAATAAPSLAIHEDTFFLGPVAAAAASGGSGMSAGSAAAVASGGGMGIYEDTVFGLPRAPAPAARAGSGGAPGGPMIFEDTCCLTAEPMGWARSAQAAAPAAMAAAPVAAAARRPLGGGAALGAAPGRGMSARPVAAEHARPAPYAHGQGGLQIYEDTENF